MMTLYKCPFPHKNNNFRRNIINIDNKEFKVNKEVVLIINISRKLTKN